MRTKPGSRNLLLILILLIGGISVSALTFGDSILPLGVVREGSFFARFTEPATATNVVVDGPQVRTDKLDYVPGEVVQISGSGFAPNEQVTLLIVHIEEGASLFSASSESLTAYDHEGHEPWQVMVKEDGTFSSSWLVQEDSINQTLRLTADQPATDLHDALHAEFIFTDKVAVDFRQCANNDGNPRVLGNCSWINSIVQASNARYFEGMSNMQRIVLIDIDPTANNNHSMTLSHQSTKGGIHAYDFLTSYEQAIKAADDAGVSFIGTKAYTPLGDESMSLNLTLTDAHACGPNIGPPNTLGATCQSLRGGANKANVELPDDNYVDSQDGSTLQRIMAYEAIYGNRYLRIYANAPINSASMTIANHDGPDTGDSDVNYVLSWNSTATQVLVEVAGHLAVTGLNNTGVNWGPGQGSSQISGGPYHFNLKLLDGGSLGSQDNQIKGADILLPGGSIVIVKDTVPNDPQDFAFTTTGTGLSNFSLDDDGDSENGLDSTKTFSGLAPGAYSVSETLSVPGWGLTNLVCNDPTSNTTVNLSIGTASINLAPGEQVMCTFRNTLQVGSIKVVKNTVGGIPGKDYTWGFTPSGFGSPFNLVTTGTDDSAESTVFGNLPVTGTYSVAETGIEDGWDLTSSSCTNGTPTNIVIVSGQTTVCTFTNTENPDETRGRIKIDKVTDPSGDPTEFTFTPGGFNGNATFKLSDGSLLFDSGLLIPVADGGGPYSIMETVPSGWTQTNATCDDGSPINAIDVGAGETVTCTFYNSKPDMTISITPNEATNEVGDAHEFTVTVTQDPNGADPALTANITWDITPEPDEESSTCDSSVDFVNNVATCTITINNNEAGSFTATAAATATVDGVELTRSTDGTGGNSAPATKLYVDARIRVTPLDDTNDVGQPHTIVAKVEKNTGSGWVVVENALVNFSLLNNAIGADFVGDAFCTTAANGECSVVFNANQVGGVDIQATTTITVNGESITRTTGVEAQNSANAHKDYVSGFITIAQNAVNEVGDPHTFTITATQIPGNATPATEANITFDVDPDAAYVSDTCNNPISFSGGMTASCTVTVSSNAVGTVTVNASTSFQIEQATVSRSTDGTGSNSGPGVKKYVSGSITIGPAEATNDVGDPHTFTVTVTQSPGDATPIATSASVVVTIDPTITPDSSTCDSDVPFVGNFATCTVTITGNVPGTFTANATGTFTLAGVNIIRSTDGTGSNSGPAVKHYVAGKIIVKKETIPNGDPAKFDFTASYDADGFKLKDGESNDSGYLAPNVYSVSESVPAGWDLTSATCEGDDDGTDPANIQLDAGEEVTCTFTNTKRVSLTLNKVVINDNGGTAVESDWTLTANGTDDNDLSGPGAPGNSDVTSSNLLPDTFALSESTGPDGYTASAWVCTGTGQQTGASIALDPGESAVCTITNTDDAPSLTLVKVVINDDGGKAVIADFTLSANGPTSISGPGGVSSGPSFDAGSYDLSETTVNGYSASPWVCEGDGTQNGANITLGLGDSATCTITNNDIPPRLVVIKHVINNNGGSATAGDFTMLVTGTDVDPSSFAGSETGTDVGLDAGTFNVDEQMPVGPQAYMKSYPATYNVPGVGTVSNACNSSGDGSIAVGQTKYCIVVNDDLAQTLVTSSSLCTFDVLPGDNDRDFRLLFTPSVQNPAYKLNATNPGQTFYNVFYAPVNPKGTETIYLEIPYPYVTHGATPIHVYGDDTTTRIVDGQTCIYPGTGIANFRDQIVIGNGYNKFGDTAVVPVQFQWPEGEDFVYINIHLDYGLKGTAGYSKGTNDDATSTLTGTTIIPNHQCYTFHAENSVPLADDTVCSINSFKKNPGVGGLNQTLTEEPVPGAKMELRTLKGQLVTTQTTDEDGWYFLNYKHTGKASDYIVVSVPTGVRKQVTLKANGMAQVDFP